MPRSRSETRHDRDVADQAAMEALTLGIDVGGTKTELVLVAADGRAVRRRRIPTAPRRGAGALIADVARVARDTFAEWFDEVRAVGVSVAGQVRTDGVLLGAPNLGWTDVPLRADVERALERPVVVANDVRAAAWAEWRAGAGRGADDLIVLFLGTGVGGAAVSGGRMLEGSNNLLGEFGHATLVAGGRQCHCRNQGCLEAYVGGWAIAELAREAVAADPAAGATLVRLAGAPDAIVAETVAAAQELRDPLAGRLVAEAGARLGAAAVGLVNSWNPARLILGGGIIEGFPELVDAAAHAVGARALPGAAGAQVLPAALGNHAPGIGAAALARWAYFSSGRSPT
jgi:glucokinase